MASKPPPPKQSSAELAPLLRHFIGLNLIVETKHGRQFRGQLREADAYMNLVLSRSQEGEKSSAKERSGAAVEAEAESFDWVHIRGPSVRYIVFGSDVDIVGVIKAGRDRERVAGDRYKRGVRKSK